MRLTASTCKLKWIIAFREASNDLIFLAPGVNRVVSAAADHGTNSAERKRPSGPFRPAKPAKQAKAPQPRSSDQEEELERRRLGSERLDALCSTVGQPRSYISIIYQSYIKQFFERVHWPLLPQAMCDL
jgi:hypothetical protein